MVVKVFASFLRKAMSSNIENTSDPAGPPADVALTTHIDDVMQGNIAEG